MEDTLKAIEILKRGGIVIFPTDTAYGIGCRIDNEESLKKLFEIRRRPKDKPLLVLVDSIKMAQDYLLPIPKKVKDNIVKNYWPGKLTIILKCNVNKIPSLVRAGKDALGVRFPNDPSLLELIRKVGVPIVAPSANFSGAKTPFRLEDLDPKLIELVDYVLKGNIDSSKKASTIIDCTAEPWKIVRQGAIKINF